MNMRNIYSAVGGGFFVMATRKGERISGGHHLDIGMALRARDDLLAQLPEIPDGHKGTGRRGPRFRKAINGKCVILSRFRTPLVLSAAWN